MRTVKKAVVLVLILAACLTCSACGAFQTQMAKTMTHMAKLQSFHTDVNADLGALLTVGGQKIRMEATITGGLDTKTDPLFIRTDLFLETLGVKRKLRLCIQKDNDTWSISSADETGAVNEENAEQQAVKRPPKTQALKLLMECGQYFADPVDDLVNGAHAKRYDGVFPEEYVDKVLALLDLKENGETTASEEAVIIQENSEEAVAEIQEREASEETGTKETENEGPDADIDGEADEEETQELPKGLPGSIWINDDNMIVQVDIDLAVFLQNLMDEGLDKLLTEYDLDDLEMDGELQYADTRLTFSRFDEVEPLSVPKP